MFHPNPPLSLSTHALPVIAQGGGSDPAPDLPPAYDDVVAPEEDPVIFYRLEPEMRRRHTPEQHRAWLAEHKPPREAMMAHKQRKTRQVEARRAAKAGAGAATDAAGGEAGTTPARVVSGRRRGSVRLNRTAAAGLEHNHRRGKDDRGTNPPSVSDDTFHSASSSFSSGGQPPRVADGSRRGRLVPWRPPQDGNNGGGEAGVSGESSGIGISTS